MAMESPEASLTLTPEHANFRTKIGADGSPPRRLRSQDSHYSASHAVSCVTEQVTGYTDLISEKTASTLIDCTQPLSVQAVLR